MPLATSGASWMGLLISKSASHTAKGAGSPFAVWLAVAGIRPATPPIRFGGDVASRHAALLQRLAHRRCDLEFGPDVGVARVIRQRGCLNSGNERFRVS